MSMTQLGEWELFLLGTAALNVAFGVGIFLVLRWLRRLK